MNIALQSINKAATRIEIKTGDIETIANVLDDIGVGYDVCYESRINKATFEFDTVAEYEVCRHLVYGKTSVCTDLISTDGYDKLMIELFRYTQLIEYYSYENNFSPNLYLPIGHPGGIQRMTSYCKAIVKLFNIYNLSSFTSLLSLKPEAIIGDAFWFKPDDRLTRLGLLKKAARLAANRILIPNNK